MKYNTSGFYLLFALCLLLGFVAVAQTKESEKPDSSRVIKLNASKLILKRIKALNRFGEWSPERPVFLLGDFNSRPGTAPYQVLVGDKNSTDPDLLKNSFEGVKKIDWIYINVQ